MLLLNLLLFALCIHINGYTKSNVLNQYRFRPTNFKIYYNLNSILKDFAKRENQILSAVQKTLYAFQHICLKETLYKKSGKRRPFIVVEGTDRILVSAVSKALTLLLGATFLHNPPRCLRQLLGKFHNASPIRRTYYALGNYVISGTVEQIYNRFSVVCPGYWLEQAAFALTNNYKNRLLPPPGDDVYKWPPDLLPPDVIYHLRTPKNNDTLMWNPSAKYDWRTRTLDVYDNVRHPKIVRLDARGGVPFLLETIIQHLNTTMRENLYITAKSVESVFPQIYRQNELLHP